MPTFVAKHKGEYLPGAQVYVKIRKEYATVLEGWDDWYEVEYDNGDLEWVHVNEMKGA